LKAHVFAAVIQSYFAPPPPPPPPLLLLLLLLLLRGAVAVAVERGGSGIEGY
jgi:hypothetical protein